jgi:hypothetical protein
MRQFASVHEVKEGSILVADDGFTCLRNGEVLTVQKDEEGLYVPCCDGQHYIDGQISDDGKTYVGLTLKRMPAS